MDGIYRSSTIASRHRDSGSTSEGIDITAVRREDESTEEFLPRDSEHLEESSGRHNHPSATKPKTAWLDRPSMLRDVWDSSWNMYILFSAGAFFAVAQHFFYLNLEGRLVLNDEQITNMRYGTLLAFAAKTSLVAAVMSAFRGQLWATVSTSFLRVVTLDDMFAAAETPLSLLNWEFLWRAKVAAALALYCWISPLSIILTTSTLATVPGEETQKTTCPGLRTLNFSKTTYREDREKTLELGPLSMSWWNITSQNTSDPYFFDYYTSPNPDFLDFLRVSTFFPRPIIDQENNFDVCKRGWNCTVKISFVGPTYKCGEISRGVGKSGILKQNTRTAAPPFSADDLAPTGNFTYIANTQQGEYAYPQMPRVFSGGIPRMNPPFPKHLGAFRTEPIIWLGYSEFNESFASEYLQLNASLQNTKAFTPVVIACEHYEANYTVESIYRDGMLIPKITDRSLLAPIINTTFMPDLNADDGTLDKTVALPESNYVLPQDLETYQRTAAYHSTGLFLRSTLNGTISKGAERTRAATTNLIDLRFPFGIVRRNVVKLIETWYGNVLISMLMSDKSRFVPVVWAAKTSESTGTRHTGVGPEADYLYPCTRSRPAVRYHYRKQILVAVYCVMISLALLGIAAGGRAVWKNGGIARDTRFSCIIQATRGPTLDKMDWGQAGTTSRDVRATKLGYGLLDTPNAPGDGRNVASTAKHPESRGTGSSLGFGFEGDVVQRRE